MNNREKRVYSKVKAKTVSRENNKKTARKCVFNKMNEPQETWSVVRDVRY